MKAIILSAGLGTRLRPLTLTTPKALLMVAGYPLIHYTLKLLQKNGVKEAAINLHHLGEVIENELGDGKRFGMHIHYSREREILGTGGGIRQAAAFFPGEPLLVINSDILIDVDLKKLIRFHQKKKGIATMVVRPRDPNSGFSQIQIGRGCRILSIAEPTRPEGQTSTTQAPLIEEEAQEGASMYTGAQVIEPKLLEYLPPHDPSCIIRQGYLPAIAAGEKVFGFHYDGYWNDLGTMDRYRQAEADLKSGKVNLSYLVSRRERSSPTRRDAKRR